MIYRRGVVFACGKGILERVGLTDMELYRHTLRKCTQALQLISVGTVETRKINTHRMRIARIIHVGGGVLPGQVHLY
jgi:hypothetical protein